MRFEKLSYDIGVGSMEVKEECCKMTIHANCELQICELYKTFILFSLNFYLFLLLFQSFPSSNFQQYIEMVSQRNWSFGPTFSYVITACGSGGFYMEGIQVHCRVISLGFGLTLFIGSSLMNLHLHMGR
ncbi:hypothetical protein Gotur_028678 [Gossypium turneri]